MRVDVDLNDPDEREAYLEELEAVVRDGHYPACNLDLPHALVDAEFVREAARDEGKGTFADRIDDFIVEAIEPIEEVPEIEDEDNISEYQLTVINTNHVFMESIGSYTTVDGETVHGGDVANEFIEADDIDEAHEALWQFTEWFEDDLDEFAEQQEEVEGRGQKYDVEEFKEIAVFNACLILVFRRRIDNPFSEKEMRVP